MKKTKSKPIRKPISTLNTATEAAIHGSHPRDFSVSEACFAASVIVDNAAQQLRRFDACHNLSGHQTSSVPIAAYRLQRQRTIAACKLAEGCLKAVKELLTADAHGEVE